MNSSDPLLTRLVEAAKKGGRPEANDLIRAVWPRAYRIAFSIVRNIWLAEDAAQEACAILFRAIARLRSTQAFGVWFYRIVVRQATMLDKRNSTTALNFETSSEPFDLDGSLLRIDVFNALATLAPAQRIAIALYFYAEMNSREISDILNIPDSSVRFHIMQAKRRLEKALNNQDIARPHEAPPGAA